MRYITHISNLVLFQNDGKIGIDPTNQTEYKFGPQGILNLGLLTTNSGAGNYINADVLGADDSLQVLSLDLKGATTISVERVGQGSLSGLNDTGASLTNVSDGYVGKFFKAPPVASGTQTSALADIWYEVLSGLVSYNGTTYRQGQRFVTDGSARTTASGTYDGTTASGYYALTIPPELINGCEAFRTEQFALNSLKKGDEPADYWNWDNNALPKDSLLSDESDFYGWTR